MSRWLPRSAALFLLALSMSAMSAGAAVSAQEQLTGKVVGVADGDTLTVLTPQKRQVKVRLDQIDAPENGQAWGQRSRQTLSRYAYGKTVRVEVSGKDRYGRSIGRVSSGGVDVNEAMVRDGAAWAYRDYLEDKTLLRVERDARDARRGLWSQPSSQITAPWAYRSAKRNAAAARSTPRPTAACARRTCTQLSSCAEAKRQMKACSLPALDSDGDGTPCESLCRG